MRSLVRWVLRSAGAVAVAAGGIAAGLAFGAVPVPTGAASVSEADTVRIAVLSNGFHTDIALPANGTTLERLGIRESDYATPRSIVDWWVVGWGSEQAYTSLTDVADLSIGLVARAVAFDDTVMHVQPAGPIRPGPGVWFVDLPAARFEALVADIATWFGSPDAIADVTQGYDDRFYPGAGHFKAWYGCNVWVGRRLRAAGVPIGVWTPAAQSLAYGLDKVVGSHP